jgi:uncharacterized membrane protein YfcA
VRVTRVLDAIPANWLFVVVSLAAAFFIGLSKGGLPIIAMLSVPMMALFTAPIAAAAMLLPIYIVSDMIGLWIYRGSFSARNLAILIPASLVGIGIGWATATLIPEHAISLVLGTMGLLFCLRQWLAPIKTRQPRPADVPRGLFWGTIMGFTSFVSHAGGPPYQMYVLPQRLDKALFAGTATILFAVVNLAKLVPYWQLDQMHVENLSLALLLIPVAIAGTFTGARLLQVIRQDVFYRTVEIALLLVSVNLIYEGALP